MQADRRRLRRSRPQAAVGRRPRARSRPGRPRGHPHRARAKGLRPEQMSYKAARDGVTSMLKSDLIERTAEENPHLYQRDVEILVNTILDTIIAALARGDRVELRDFGVFAVKTRGARAGRNPRNGAQVAVAEK